MHALVRGQWQQRLRLISGLILFAFVLTHFLNHALGLISIGAMDWLQTLRWKITRSQVGTVVLLGAILVHIALAFLKLLRRTTWRMPIWEAVQIASGFLIPFFLIPHVVSTRFAAELFGLNDYYLYALIFRWPEEAIKTAILMSLAWVHACLGMHFWLRLSKTYLKFFPLFNLVAVAVPLLAYAGFSVAGRAANLKAASPDAMARIVKSLRIPDSAAFDTLRSLSDGMILGFAFLIAATLAYAVWRRHGVGSSAQLDVTYLQGPSVRTSIGPTLLEISRRHNIPHTSVCGGRARCSTCRVRVDAGLDLIHPPEPAERRTLESISADKSVRLACQVRPKSPLTVFRLVASEDASVPHIAASELTELDAGVERELVILFLDVRGFTRWSEGKLPYDVVFLLNEFFTSASRAVEAEGGWIDKYMGDGMMAVFGRTVAPQEAAQQALRAVAAIDKEIEIVAERLSSEVGEAIKIGLGLHAGNVVLGRIGPVGAGALTVIGEAVNTASRLESLTSSMGLQLIISKQVADLSGANLRADVETDTNIRGLQKPVAIYGFEQARTVLSGMSGG